MVATHDPVIIAAVPGITRESGRSQGDFEYQMLYGVRDDEQRRLTGAGNHVRVYVPFGTRWYRYFLRRLAERPANLAFFLRALTDRRRARGAPSAEIAGCCHIRRGCLVLDVMNSSMGRREDTCRNTTR